MKNETMKIIESLKDFPEPSYDCDWYNLNWWNCPTEYLSWKNNGEKVVLQIFPDNTVSVVKHALRAGQKYGPDRKIDYEDLKEELQKLFPGPSSPTEDDILERNQRQLEQDRAAFEILEKLNELSGRKDRIIQNRNGEIEELKQEIRNLKIVHDRNYERMEEEHQKQIDYYRDMAKKESESRKETEEKYKWLQKDKQDLARWLKETIKENKRAQEKIKILRSVIENLIVNLQDLHERIKEVDISAETELKG